MNNSTFINFEIPVQVGPGQQFEATLRFKITGIESSLSIMFLSIFRSLKPSLKDAFKWSKSAATPTASVAPTTVIAAENTRGARTVGGNSTGVATTGIQKTATAATVVQPSAALTQMPTSPPSTGETIPGGWGAPTDWQGGGGLFLSA